MRDNTVSFLPDSGTLTGLKKGRRSKVLRLAISGTAALAMAACTQGPDGNPSSSISSAPAEQSIPRQVNITAGASTIVAQLDDTPTAQSFAALLPLRLPLRDHASTEKVAALPQKLSLEGAPAGTDADAYDLAYYAPLGNFVMYYRDPGYFPGLVRLGRIQAGAETLQSASGTVTIEAVGR